MFYTSLALVNRQNFYSSDGFYSYHLVIGIEELVADEILNHAEREYT